MPLNHLHNLTISSACDPPVMLHRWLLHHHAVICMTNMMLSLFLSKVQYFIQGNGEAVEREYRLQGMTGAIKTLLENIGEDPQREGKLLGFLPRYPSSVLVYTPPPIPLLSPSLSFLSPSFSSTLFFQFHFPFIFLLPRPSSPSLLYRFSHSLSSPSFHPLLLFPPLFSLSIDLLHHPLLTLSAPFPRCCLTA